MRRAGLWDSGGVGRCGSRQCAERGREGCPRGGTRAAPVGYSSGWRSTIEALLSKEGALFLAGLLVLVGGGELLVRGASRLARVLGVSPFIIGLTVAAWGTSMPELVVGVVSSVKDEGALLIGNVVGSNIINTFLILGLAAVILPIAVGRGVLRVDLPVMVAATVIFSVLSMTGQVARGAGALFIVAIAAYMGWLLWVALRQNKEVEENGGPRPPRSRLPVYAGAIVVGLVLLAWGAHWMVDSAVVIAERWGVSRAVIGVTIVAIGTSLPELAICVVAAVRRHHGIAAGNIIGSNIFNIFLIVGVSALVRPLEVERSFLWHDYPVMLGSAVLLWALLAIGRRLTRGEGAVMFIMYVVYMGWVVVRQTGG